MALNAAYYAQPTHPRFLDVGEDSGGAGGGDSDGGGGDGGPDRLQGQVQLFPAVYNNGGSVANVSYIIQAFTTPLQVLFNAAGFVYEGQFWVNNGGLISYVYFLTRSDPSPPGPLPLGVAEWITTLTKDGATNVSRWLIRIGP